MRNEVNIKNDNIIMLSGEEFAYDGGQKYRYSLTKIWNINDREFNFIKNKKIEIKNRGIAIMLNPSKASLVEGDNTVTNVINTMYNEHKDIIDGVTILNLFAFKNTNPSTLKDANKKYEEKNMNIIKDYIKDAKIIFIGWGVTFDKDIREQAKDKRDIILKILDNKKYRDKVFCFKLKNKPIHPRVIKEGMEYINYFTEKRD